MKPLLIKQMAALVEWHDEIKSEQAVLKARVTELSMQLWKARGSPSVGQQLEHDALHHLWAMLGVDNQTEATQRLAVLLARPSEVEA